MIMHLSEILNAELDAFRERTGKTRLDILETGTIRGTTENYRVGDGWSTITFAEHVKANGGTLTSIDLDITNAELVLKEKRLTKYVNLIKGASVQEIKKLATTSATSKTRAAKRSVDVAFLDSGNDASLTFSEYLAVKEIMRAPGLVIVDDVDMNSHEVVKGHEIVPFLQANEVPHRIIERVGDGFRTGVLVFEV
jgi:predicted O-methyltransferase YrrM